MLFGRTSKIRRCDIGVCVVSGTEYNLLLFNFRVYIYTRSYPVNVSLSSITALTVTDFCHKQFVILSHTVEVNR